MSHALMSVGFVSRCSPRMFLPFTATGSPHLSSGLLYCRTGTLELWTVPSRSSNFLAVYSHLSWCEIR